MDSREILPAADRRESVLIIFKELQVISYILMTGFLLSGEFCSKEIIIF